MSQNSRSDAGARKKRAAGWYRVRDDGLGSTGGAGAVPRRGWCAKLHPRRVANRERRGAGGGPATGNRAAAGRA
ncbi:hypothetical protein WS68_07235 [Burkholderia sp. TSV86]|nr:hypothetical protein WS68_07235 [Burkholderia sp. TSV86]